jgi:hypothetical protein
MVNNRKSENEKSETSLAAEARKSVLNTITQVSDESNITQNEARYQTKVQKSSSVSWILTWKLGERLIIGLVRQALIMGAILLGALLQKIFLTSLLMINGKIPSPLYNGLEWSGWIVLTILFLGCSILNIKDVWDYFWSSWHLEEKKENINKIKEGVKDNASAHEAKVL